MSASLVGCVYVLLLKASGATFYGAYWCKYCGGQRSLFGAEAAAALPYVECDSEGYGADNGACKAASVRAFPTWQIGGEFYGGMRSLEELGKLSGFDPKAGVAVASTTSKGGGGAGVYKGPDCKLSEGAEDCD